MKIIINSYQDIKNIFLKNAKSFYPFIKKKCYNIDKGGDAYAREEN